jgi:hypothetical protein
MSDTPRTGEPRLTLSTLLSLVSFALVAGLTAIAFGVASFSTLYLGEATPSHSGYRDSSQELEHGRSDDFPHIHPNRRPVSRETDPQSSAAEVTVIVPPDLSPAHNMRPPEVSEPSPPGVGEGSATQDPSLSGTPRSVGPEVSEPPPPGLREGSAMQDASLSGTPRTAGPELSEPSPPGVGEGSATQDASLSGTTRTAQPEVSGPSPPGVGEGSATQDASLSGTTLNLPDPALKRDQIFRRFTMHQVPKATLGTPHAGMPMQNMQEGQTHDLSNNVAFWMYRERKECGPITDRALRADCVSSFRAQYRLHSAGPTKGTRDSKYWWGRQSWSPAAH